MDEILKTAAWVVGGTLLALLLLNGAVLLAAWRATKPKMKTREEWLGPLDVIEARKAEENAVLGGQYADGLLEGLRRQERERKAKLPTC